MSDEMQTASRELIEFSESMRPMVIAMIEDIQSKSYSLGDTFIVASKDYPSSTCGWMDRENLKKSIENSRESGATFAAEGLNELFELPAVDGQARVMFIIDDEYAVGYCVPEASGAKGMVN